MNILFIGDLRTAFNYGAIATSDVLIRMVKQTLGDGDQLKIIDHRSFMAETPIEGWPEWTKPGIPKPSRFLGKLKRGVKSAIVAFLKEFTFFYVRSKRLGRNQSPSLATHVPTQWRDYETFCQQVVAGKRLPYEKALLEWADLVIVNSEGNIVNGIDRFGRYKEGPRYVLFLEYLAKKMGKKVAVINHTVDPDSEDGIEMVQQVYPMLDYVAVREPLSIEKLKELGVEKVVDYIPDALFSYVPESDWEPSEALKSIIDFSKPYICLGDSSGMSSLASTVKWDVYTVFGDLVDQLRAICPQIVIVDGFSGNLRVLNTLVKEERIPRVNLHNCSYEELIQVLGQAKCFVSGRWHASIMGLLSGTPFILWGSDSHKTKSLSVIYDYPFRFYNVHTLPLHMKEMCADVKMAIEQEPALRARNMQTTLQLRERAFKNVNVLKKWLGESAITR
jgi:polysaccharide pyruvyl transferase WcaK-like protein